MQLLGKDDAFRTLSPLFSRLDRVIRDGWEEWKKARLGHNWGSRTRANIVNEEILHAARRHLTEATEVVTQKLCIFVFDSKYALRFKKLNSDMTSCNVRTRQNTQFRRQECLDGMPAFHNLEVGYLLNKLETEIVSTHLVCPSGLHSHAWQLSLDEVIADSTTATVLQFPTAPSANTERVKFRPRKSGIDTTTDQADESGV